jgi:hypothetical protein
MLDASSQAPRAKSLYVALALAAENKEVRAVLNRVASTRIENLQCAYADLGLPAAQAKTTAVLAYAAYRGLLQLAHEAPESLPKDWVAYGAEVRRAMIPKAPGKSKRR